MTRALTASFRTGNEPLAVGGLGNRKRRGFGVSCGQEIRWLPAGLEKMELELSLELCGLKTPSTSPSEIRNRPPEGKERPRKRKSTSEG